METGEIPTNSRHCGLDPQSPRTSSLTCNPTDFQTALEIVKILIQHAAHVFSQIPPPAEKNRNANLKQLFLEKLQNEFSRKEYLDIATSINIQTKTAERYITNFVKNALISRLARDRYTKKS
jgi:hypothetical protein